MYLEYVLANDEHAKEVKLFGIGPLLMGRYRKLSEAFYDEDKKIAVKRAGITHALSMLATFAFYGAYALMALLAASGKLTLGNMTLYILAFRQGQQSFQSILSGIGSHVRAQPLQVEPVRVPRLGARRRERQTRPRQARQA